MYNEHDVEEISKLILDLVKLGFEKRSILEKSWNMAFAIVSAYNDIEKRPIATLYSFTSSLLQDAVKLSVKKGERNVNQ